MTRSDQMHGETAQAFLAGGCFWGMEELIRQLPGVISTTVGYAGGKHPAPTYQDVKTGETGHAETVKIVFSPKHLSYLKLLEFFFQIHNPCTRNAQGNDRGTSYRSIIFYTTEEQRAIAENLMLEIEKSGKWPGKIVTELIPYISFYPAEGEHQKYLQRYPDGYTCHFIRPDWNLGDDVK